MATKRKITINPVIKSETDIHTLDFAITYLLELIIACIQVSNSDNVALRR